MKEKQVSTNKFILPVLFILFSIIWEFVNFIYIGFKDSSGNTMILPSYFLFDLGIILVIAGLIYLVQNKIAMNIIFFAFLTLQFVFNVVNLTMYGIFGDILSFDLLKLGAEATTAMSVDLIDWGGLFLNIGVFGVMITSVVLLFKKNKKTITLKTFSMPVIILALFILSQSLGFGLFEVQRQSLTEATSVETEIETSDRYLWDNFQFKLDAFKKFGTYGFYAKSIANLIPKSEEVNTSEYVDFIDSGFVEQNPDAPLYNDNLIVILCESLDWYGIDPYNTPTLWKIANGEDSIVFEEFYARNRTNYSEALTLLGNVPKNFLIKTAYDNGYEFQYSLPKLFKSTSPENTTASYFHPNNKEFYNRNVTHGKDGIGFDSLNFIDSYSGPENYKWGTWIKDVSFIEEKIDEFLPTEGRFLSYFASLSTHGPHDKEQKYLKDYYDVFDENFDEYKTWTNENTKYIIPTNSKDFSRFRTYKVGVMDLDRTVQFIIDNLEERGLKDNTSILLFADHNSYFSNMAYNLKGVKKSDFSNTYVNNIPVMLYSPKLAGMMEEHKVTSFCSTYDILPTLCDLYGLPMNKNLFQGNSVFSEDIKNSIFCSNLSGMFTNNIFSFNISDIYVTDESVTEKEIEAFKRNANNYWKTQAKLEVIFANGINGSKLF